MDLDLEWMESRQGSREQKQEYRDERGIHPVSRSGGVGRWTGVALGMLPQLAALGLILVMRGAIQKKIAVWHTGFWAAQRRLARY